MAGILGGAGADERNEGRLAAIFSIGGKTSNETVQLQCNHILEAIIIKLHDIYYVKQKTTQ